MNRRKVLKAAAFALSAGVAAPRHASAQNRRVINFVPQSDLTLLDPVQTTGLVTRNHGLMVFDTLYGVDERFQIQPQMAAGHLIEKDGLRWTITLRDGLRFHDGEPVRARDAAASIRRWWARDVFGGDLRDASAELTAPDDKTLVFDLKRPFPLLAYALGKPSGICPIMPERLANTPGTEQVTQMVGSGPFQFVPDERVIGSQVVYRRFEGYQPRSSGSPSFMAGPKVVHVDRVVWRVLPDAATAAAALQVGEVDWWEQPTPDLIPLLQRRRNITVEVKDTGGYLAMIRLNHLVAPFDNPAVRRAILSAINQSEYMTAVMGTDKAYWKDNVGFFLPESPFANGAGMDVFSGAPNYAKAKEDLVKAGYKGERIVFVVPTDLHALNSMSLVAADMFRKIGLNVDYQNADWGTVLQRVASQRPLDQGGWSAWCNYVPGATTINPSTHTYLRGIGRAGTFGWPSSEKIEELRNTFLSAQADSDKERLVRDIQTQAFLDTPYLPLGYFAQPTAYSQKLRNVPVGFSQFYNVVKD
jgi:peptide/nickel transport system substrate-binding protein